ncbi:MAG TPA: phosphatidate cytidylyltransferase [Candidatus Limnocylindrales bacterium]|nr:phosphatidate cytidylyltransferase [Candidatus Limnocylindrales bacterium]
MLRTRILTAAVLVPLIIAVVIVGEPWISLLVGVVAFLALVELVALLDAAGYEPPQVLSIVAGMALTAAGLVTANQAVVGDPLSSVLNALDPPGLVAATLVAVVLLLGAAGFTRADPRRGFVTWAMSTFGVAYVGLLLPTLVLVAHLAPPGGTAATPVGMLEIRSGAAWAFLLILVVWGYDTGAYLIGRVVGRRRLVDHISPSKTVEGLFGGLLVATIGAGVGAALVGLEPWHPLVIGPLVGLAAQAGDLAESMLKRAADRKESGFLVPGHGGILDRIDSFLFAAPVLAGYALLVAGRVA